MAILEGGSVFGPILLPAVREAWERAHWPRNREERPRYSCAGCLNCNVRGPNLSGAFFWDAMAWAKSRSWGARTRYIYIHFGENQKP